MANGTSATGFICDLRIDFSVVIGGAGPCPEAYTCSTSLSYRKKFNAPQLDRRSNHSDCGAQKTRPDSNQVRVGQTPSASTWLGFLVYERRRG